MNWKVFGLETERKVLSEEFSAKLPSKRSNLCKEADLIQYIFLSHF